MFVFGPLQEAYKFCEKAKTKKRKKFKYPIRMVFKQVCVENVHKAVQYGHFYLKFWINIYETLFKSNIFCNGFLQPFLYFYRSNQNIKRRFFYNFIFKSPLNNFVIVELTFQLVFITELALSGHPDSPLPRAGRRGVLKLPPP